MNDIPGKGEGVSQSVYAIRIEDETSLWRLIDDTTNVENGCERSV
jgi:hypothetical protein